MRDDKFSDEAPTQPLPYVSLAEVAAAWREQQQREANNTNQEQG